MKKLLALLGVTSLVLNSSAVGVFLLSNTIQSDVNKIKNSSNNSELSIETNILINDLLSHLDTNVLQQKENYRSITDIIDLILPFIKNKSLSNDVIVKIIDGLVRKLKEENPNIDQYLSYTRFGRFLSLGVNELANDWDQQVDHGNSSLEAMKNFIASDKGNIAQAKTAGKKGEWHYVEVRARNWNWNDFYQYMAGANMNYMVKILSGGNYIGNLVNKYLDIGPWKYGFNKEAFLEELGTSMQKILETKEAWPYLVKTIMPLLKTKILNQENPTLGFDNLTWEKTTNKNLSLKTLITELKRLLSEAGRNDLIKLFVSLLTGPFGEDIIIDIGTFGYYTFPEILEVVNRPPLSWIIKDLKPELLATEIVDQLLNITNDLGIVDILDDVINKTEAGIDENPIVDLKELSIDLNKIYANSDFEIGLEKMIDIINNPKTSEYTLQEVFKIWGTQIGEEDFKKDSPLFIIKKWIDNPKSILHQILNILRNIEKNKRMN